jgi:hypothetical protein
VKRVGLLHPEDEVKEARCADSFPLRPREKHGGFKAINGEAYFTRTGEVKKVAGRKGGELKHLGISTTYLKLKGFIKANFLPRKWNGGILMTS